MTDWTLQKMEQYKIPMTRENYLNLAYFGNPPEQLSAEEEAEIPQQFRGNSSQEEPPEEEAEETPEQEAAEKET